MLSCTTLARNVYNHSFGYASRNLDLDYLFAFNDAGASTFLTLILDNSTFAVTCRTLRLCLHHAKHSANCAGNDTATVTCRTSLACATLLCARTVTMSTCNVLLHLELLCGSGCNLLERKRHLYAQIGTAVLRFLTLTSTAKASEAAESTAMSAEHVTEHREDIVHRETTGATESATAESAARSIKAKLVILLAFLRVVKHIVSLCCFLELLLSLFIARVTVRVIFDSYLSIRLLYFVVCGGLADAKHFIIVSLCHYILMNKWF